MNALIEMFVELQRAEGENRTVFVHEATILRTRWHFGECFPDVETCAIPNGADMDANPQ